MDSILAAVPIIFLVLFSGLTLSSAIISGQDRYQADLRDLQYRLIEQSRTSLRTISTLTADNGTVIRLAYENNGSTRLTDFNHWDMIVQYNDTAAPSEYHIAWLPYEAGIPSSNEWTVAGIYADLDRNLAEAYEIGILNPGETLLVEAHLAQTIASGTQIQTVLAANNGAARPEVFVRNTPPVLAVNNSLLIASGTTAPIGEAKLKTTDVDNDPDELIYTVTTAPTQGTLSLGTTFSQEDITNNLLSYTHSGSGSDSFQFSVNDGQDQIGTYTLTINVSVPPVLQTNAGLTLPTNTTAVINTAALQTTDVDNTTAEITYTMTALPTQGSVSMTTFTQADIDNGLLTYTHVGAGADSFQFKVTDGVSEIGPFTFAIAVT